MNIQGWEWGVLFGASLLLAPLLTGVVNRTKAVFAGRQGPDLLQLYYDLFKLMRKGNVYSTTTTSVFRFAPLITLASLMTAMAFLPYAGCPVPAVFSFQGDLILFLYLFALGRMATVLASLDTASAFCGMGASREVQFSAIAEPAFIASLAVLGILSGSMSLSVIFTDNAAMNLCSSNGTMLLLIAASLFFLLLSECCRVPFDDPCTHLELTMIHEAMILDYSGPDLACILYGASLKMWTFATLIILALVPFDAPFPMCAAIFFCAMLVMGVLVGTVESVMARFRFVKVPQMLIGALALAVLALVLKCITMGD